MLSSQVDTVNQHYYSITCIICLPSFAEDIHVLFFWLMRVLKIMRLRPCYVEFWNRSGVLTMRSVVTVCFLVRPCLHVK